MGERRESTLAVMKWVLGETFYFFPSSSRTLASSSRMAASFGARVAAASRFSSARSRSDLAHAGRAVGLRVRLLRDLAEQHQRLDIPGVHLDHEVQLLRCQRDAAQVDLHLGVGQVRQDRMPVDALGRHVRRERLVVLLHAAVGVPEVQPCLVRVLVLLGGGLERRGRRLVLAFGEERLALGDVLVELLRPAAAAGERRGGQEQGAQYESDVHMMRDLTRAQTQSDRKTIRKITRMQVAVSWYWKSFMVLMSEKPRPPAPTSPRMVAARMLTSKR